MEEENTPRVVPVIEEELVTGTRLVKTGSVKVRKEVERIQKEVEISSLRDSVRVTRIPVNRVVTAVPEVREEGGILIVPVVEEKIVIQKRLVLKEEIHIIRERVEERVKKSVTLERERAIVERLDRDGVVIETL